jgi:hypothetical protein
MDVYGRHAARLRREAKGTALCRKLSRQRWLLNLGIGCTHHDWRNKELSVSNLTLKERYGSLRNESEAEFVVIASAVTGV